MLLGTVVALTTTVEVGTNAEAGLSLALPDSLPGWKGTDIEVSRVEKEYLPPDTGFAKKVYVDEQGRQIYLSIVMAGKERASIHRPEVCLPGQGFKTLKSEVVEIPGLRGPSGAPLKATRLLLERETISRQTGKSVKVGFYYVYWFVGKNRVTPSHLERILLNTYDRAVHGVSHRWAYVSYLTPIYEDPKTDAVILSDFIALSYPKFGIVGAEPS